MFCCVVLCCVVYFGIGIGCTWLEREVRTYVRAYWTMDHGPARVLVTLRVGRRSPYRCLEASLNLKFNPAWYICNVCDTGWWIGW